MKHVTTNSGGLPASKNVGTEVTAGNLMTGDMLKSRPILGSDQDLLPHPLGDRLLAEGGAAHKPPQAIGQGSLAASDLNRPLQSGNVRFIHEHRDYTTGVVRVNDRGCVPAHNVGCTVIYMPARPKLASPPPQKSPRIRQARRGPDGKTFGERLKACMAMRAHQLGIPADEYGQVDLIADATRAVGRNPDREDERVISQQGVSLILNNKVSESHASIAFALVFGVEPAWLQYGIGEPTVLRKLLAQS